jgi:hypothetical protein
MISELSFGVWCFLIAKKGYGRTLPAVSARTRPPARNLMATYNGAMPA